MSVLYSVELKALLLQGLSEPEPEFCGELLHQLKKIFGKNDFHKHFKKTIVRHKKIGYYKDVLRQTACLVVDLVKL